MVSCHSVIIKAGPQRPTECQEACKGKPQRTVEGCRRVKPWKRGAGKGEESPTLGSMRESRGCSWARDGEKGSLFIHSRMTTMKIKWYEALFAPNILMSLFCLSKFIVNLSGVGNTPLGGTAEV